MNILTQFYEYFDIQTVALLVMVTYSVYKLQNFRNLPPGPWGIPIFGYFPFLSRDLPLQTIAKLTPKYGGVISIQFGSKTIIFLNDYQSIKEGFANSSACSFRPLMESLKYLVPQNSTVTHLLQRITKDISVMEGEEATHHRRFMVTTLKEFGMGKKSLEPKILDEVSGLIEAIKSLNGEATNLSEILVATSANVIWLLEHGRRFEYTDELFQKILEHLGTFMQHSGLAIFNFFFPWLQYIPVVNLMLTRGNKALDAMEALEKIFKDCVQQRKLIYNTGDKNDYVDAYLTDRANQIEKNGNEGFFGIRELFGNMLILFGAGADTTANTMLWGILYLIKYPSAYEKIDKEIKNVIGMDREPSLSDKLNMPYIQAFLMEVLRINPPLPFGFFHSNVKKTTVCGQPIPKRSNIIGNIWAVHHDSKIWGDPNVFRPERFIDEKGQLKKSDYLIPFSIGKRNCVGESLAHMELFLTFTSLCQRFRFETENGISPCLDGDIGLVYKPKAHKIRAIAK